MSLFGKPNHTTKHQYFEEKLSAYLDGELVPQERDAVERHLATCQACQWDLATLRRTVKWMRELPTVPVPRVFTVPVSAMPARASQPRWRFVPALQVATAMVALLLFFAVAGDFMFGSFRLAGSRAPTLMQEQSAPQVEVTKLVEVLKEVAVTVEAEMVVETVQVEKAVSEPLAMAAPTAEPAPAEAAEAPAEPEEGRVGVAGAPSADAVEEEMTSLAQADEATRTAIAPSAKVEEPPSGAGGESTPNVLTTPSPLPTAAPPEPTVVAAAPEPAQPLPTEQDRALTLFERPRGIYWLRVAEFALGVLLIFLTSFTVVFTVLRRRAR
jgi:hypothetical protein